MPIFMRVAAIDASEKKLAIRRKFAAAMPEDNEFQEWMADALNILCWYRTIFGEPERALADCDESLKIRPDNADTFDSRGHAFLRMGQVDKAIVDFDAALRIG